MTEPDKPDQTMTSTHRRSGQAYVLFAISLLLVVTIGSVVQLISISVGLVFTELVLILLPAILFVRWKGIPIARALRWRRVTPTTALLSVAVGVTGWGVAAGIHELTMPILGEPPEIAGFAPQTLPHLLLLYLCGALLAGICEETLFRGAIQGVLQRHGPAKAVVITAVLFAVYHVNPWIFLPALFLGFVFGTLVVRTGSTVPAMLSHMTNNATAFTVIYVYRDQPDSAPHLLMALLAAAFGVAFVGFWICTRGAGPERPLLSTVPARLSRLVAWMAGLFGGGAVLLVVAAVGAVFSLVDIHTMQSDTLAPEIQRGDRVVVLNRRWLDLDLEAGDIISFGRDGKTLLRRTARIEGDRVWVLEGSLEEEIAREEITGKVLHTIKAD